MADLAREDGVEPETRPISPEPSRTVLEPEKRASCDHVVEGEPIAGFVSITVNARFADGRLVGKVAASREVLVDLCASCQRKVLAGGNITYDHDRRHGQPRDRKTRPSSSVAEHPADNREVAAETTSTDVAEALGSTPAMGSTLPNGKLTVRYEIGDQVVEFFSRRAAPTYASIKQSGARLLDVVSIRIDPVGMGLVGNEIGPVRANPPEFAKYQQLVEPWDEHRLQGEL